MAKIGETDGRIGETRVNKGWTVALIASTASGALAPAGPASAGSAAQPGQTVGLPTGAQLPLGFYFVNLSSFGLREATPSATASNVNLPTFAWSTPATVLGARLQLFAVQPVVASSLRGADYRSGFGQTLLGSQLAWNLGHDFGVSYFFGGYLPSDTGFVTREGSLSHRFAASYTGDGLNLTANLLYGFFPDGRFSPTVAYPDYLNLDLTATKKFGRFEVGPVAFGSMDLPLHVEGYRRQGQVAAGLLAGYNFGPANVQAYVTRDVVERGYGGRDTRGWLRIIVPIVQDKGDVEPNRTLVTRRQAE